MNGMRLNQQNRQQGATLLVALLLLMVLTMVGITSMESSNLSFKMSVNMIHHDEAFNNSESARTAAMDVIPDYLDAAEWDAVSMPSGLDVAANAGDLLGDNVRSDNTPENPLDSSTLRLDLVFSEGDMNGDIYVLKGRTVQNTMGAGSAQYKGYSGAGAGIGGPGGAFKFFELRSHGKSSGSAESWTASDYRYVF